MKSRRTNRAMDEGGHMVRPLSALWCVVLGIVVVVLLAIAIQQSIPIDEHPPFQQMPTADGASDVRQIDWESLPDSIVAWVEVPGTNIDEPIVQADSSCPNRFLYEDALGQGAYGTPYIDCDCSVDSPFVVVYGHHMDDGRVFAGFASFIDRDYAENHRTVYVYTRADNRRHILSVKAVDVVNANSERIRTNFRSDEDCSEYLNKSILNSDLVIDSSETPDETVWAFATCSYQTTNSRTVVFAIESPEIAATVSGVVYQEGD